MLPIPVFRVEKNANYTTMSNYHLRDSTISFKAKGILSMFLSLPKDWSYSVSGLAAISKEGKDGIINYAKTREVYVQYRKAGYSKAFFEAHREEITLHKAAKDAFQKMGVSKLPKVKELSEEYATVLEQKKSLYAQYRLAREEMREYQKALHNTEVFFDMDRIGERDNRTQSEVEQKNQPAK